MEPSYGFDGRRSAAGWGRRQGFRVRAKEESVKLKVGAKPIGDRPECLETRELYCAVQGFEGVEVADE